MIVFLTWRYRDIKMQYFFDITFYEAFTKIRDVDEVEISHTFFMRCSVFNTKLSSFILKLEFDKYISYWLSIFKDVSNFLIIELSFAVNDHIIINVSDA
jgi:hypothetical protein